MNVSAGRTRHQDEADEASVVDGPPGRRAEPRPRLVVELTRATGAQLDELVELEELNKTTIVNRALQVYAFLRKAERDGGQLLLLDAGETTPQRIRFL